MTFSYLELFNYLGGILGLLVSAIILAFTERNNYTKYSLTFLLTVSSLIVILGALNYSGKVVHVPFLIRFDSPFHYLLGPALYFYILTSFNEEFRFRHAHLVHLLPFLINILFFLPFYLQSEAEKVEYYHSWVSGGSYVIPLLYLSKILITILYFCLQIFIFIRHYPKNRKGSKNDRFLVSWYFLFFAGQFIMIGGMVIDHLTGLNLFDDPYRFAMSMVSLFLYLASVALLFFPQILYGKEALASSVQKKYSYSSLSQPDKNAILDSLASHLNSGNMPFRDPDISLNKLATALNISPHRLSQVINENTGMNFNDYLNQYRIVYAKKLLTSPDYHKYTIDAIALEAGFNSRSPFYNAFKKQTGITPRQYIINSKNSSDKKRVNNER